MPDKNLRAIVLGAAGRMGSRIISLIQDSEGIELGAAVEQKGHPSVGLDITEVIPGQRGVVVTDDLASVLDQGDVIIDFTVPTATLTILDLAVEKRKAMVIGTTGLGPEGLKKVRQAVDRIACVYSPNMSVGVNVMFKIAKEVATLLGREYDVEILEAHHRFKKDAPSGTALRLAEILASASGHRLEDVAAWSRKGQVGERQPSEIGIQVIRAGDIVGEHTVIFGGLGERLELTHRAHNRDNFARGAILAAQWVAGRPPGLYEMAHVLGFSP